MCIRDRFYIDEYENCIDLGIVTSPQFENKWKKYNTNDVSDFEQSVTKDQIAEPLLNCLWNQDYPYNMHCPEDEEGPGGHVYAGCVATAMSMVMHYYQYPVKGEGSHDYYASDYGTQLANFGETTYNWDAMMGDADNSYETQSAIALLMYHCGVAVDMGYSPTGSGSQSHLVDDAIKDHFGYDNSAVYVAWSSSITWDLWGDLIRKQIDSLQPIYYSGQSTDGGHAFVCDGYDNNNKFHFNFGWSGSANGYYALSGMDNPVGGFDGGQAMVQEFIPNKDAYPYSVPAEKVLTYASGSISDGSGPIESYSTNLNRRWLIKSDSELHPFGSVELRFVDFDLEPGNDVLTIYNGPTTSSDIVAQYTGNDVPEDLIIFDKEVLIDFTSDNNDSDHNGFLIEYVGLESEFCSGTSVFSASVGSFSDGSGPLYYNNGTMCMYRIAPENATTITLQFNSIDLADTGDYIKIENVENGAELANYSYGDNPTELVCNTSAVYITCKTNGQGVAQGFEIQYTSDGDE